MITICKVIALSSASVALLVDANTIRFIPTESFTWDNKYGEELDTPLQDALVGSYLAKGAFGKTFKASIGADAIRTKTTNAVVKVVNTRTFPIHEHELMWDLLKNEFHVNKLLSTGDRVHPAIVRTQGMRVSRSSGQAYIVMELCTGLELTHLIRYTATNRRDRPTLSDDDKKIAAAQFVSAIAHMHNNNIIYRDIMPANSFYNPHTKQLKLLDFGMAKVSNGHEDLGCGTPNYYAPELINN